MWARAVAPVVTASGAAPACTVEYSVTGQWDTGFQGAVTITNNGAALNSWSLGFDFAGGQKVTQGWNAKWSQSGTTVTAANESYNGALGTGASVSAGFLASWSGANTAHRRVHAQRDDVQRRPGADPTPHPRPHPHHAHDDPPIPRPAAPARPSCTSPATSSSTPSGATRRLLGVNRSGGEFMCVQGNGIFDGPVDDAAVRAIADWKRQHRPHPAQRGVLARPVQHQARSTRAPTTSPPSRAWSTASIAHGMTPIVELHWTHGQYTGNSAGCSDVHATCQKPMPDAQYAPAFWTSVANTFKGDPRSSSTCSTSPTRTAPPPPPTQAWTCWRDGGTCPGIGYEVAGMQDLVDAVRGTGAQNVVLAGGLAYSNDLSQWLDVQARPTRRAIWPPPGTSTTSTPARTATAGTRTLAPVAAQVPLVAGEIGENTCAHALRRPAS